METPYVFMSDASEAPTTSVWKFNGILPVKVENIPFNDLAFKSCTFEEQ